MIRKLGVMLSLLLVFCCACSDPDIGNVIVEDIDQYLLVNEFVEEKLQTRFKGVLPANKDIQSDGAQYYYQYDCAVLGDPNFLIYLSNRHTEPASFSDEVKRIDKLACRRISADLQETVYLIEPTNTDVFSQYTDDEIQDGLAFVFEMAIVNDETMTIEYLAAFYQDNHARSEIIDRFIEPLC